MNEHLNKIIKYSTDTHIVIDYDLIYGSLLEHSYGNMLPIIRVEEGRLESLVYLVS